MESILQAQVWRNVVSRLGTRRESGACNDGASPFRTPVPHCDQCGGTIAFVEWVNSKSAILSWKASTSGVYGEQLWKLRTAKRLGSCAISGKKIRRGNAVFRPWHRGDQLVPVNANCEILEQSLREFGEWETSIEH
jgi:hypothetical protein